MRGMIPVRGQISINFSSGYFCLFSEENAKHGVTSGRYKEREEGMNW